MTGVMAEGFREPSAASLIILDGVSAPKCGQLLELIASLSSILDPQLLSQENSKCLTLCDNHWRLSKGKGTAYTKAKKQERSQFPMSKSICLICKGSKT